MPAAPSLLIYQAAGSPVMPGDMRGICRTCGLFGAGMPFEKWVKDSFNDLDKLLPGEIACHACLFCFSDQNVALQARLGKEKVQKTRNYSHFVLGNEWTPLSKGGKAQMKELLRRSPEVAVIADSGQKHLIFRARAGWWQFEEQALLPCPELLTGLLEPVEALYGSGASKAEIESGRYDHRTIQKIGVIDWRMNEARIKKQRGGLPFKLVIFLAQKEEEEDGDGPARTDGE